MLSIYQKLKKILNSDDLDSFFEGNKCRKEDYQFEVEKMMIHFDNNISNLYQTIANFESEDLIKMVYVLAKLSNPIVKKAAYPGMATSFFEYVPEMFELHSESSTFNNDEYDLKDLDQLKIHDGFGAFKNIAGERLSLPKLSKDTTLIPHRVAIRKNVDVSQKVLEQQKPDSDSNTKCSNNIAEYRASLKPELKRSMLAWDPQMVPQYQTETSYYRGFYEKFMLHPYLTREELNLVPEAELLDKLFNAFLGMESDLFSLESIEIFKLDFIRIETVGSRALMQFLSKFLKSAQILNQLQNYTEEIEIGSMTGSTLSGALKLVIRMIRLNIINLQTSHQRSPIRLLQLQKLMEPIQTLCEELELDFLAIDHPNLNNLLSHLYNRITTMQLNHLYTPYLVWIFQKSCEPLFKFITMWIVSRANDRFGEFFITNNEYRPHLVPSFIPQTLSEKIYNLHSLDCSPDLNFDFCPKWMIEQDARREYLIKFEEDIAFKMDVYKDEYLREQMEHLNNLQVALDTREIEKSYQVSRLEQIHTDANIQREMIERRKKELKDSVEEFLESQREFKLKKDRLADLENQRELNAMQLKNLESEKLMDLERNQIVTRFEVALKKLEKREALLQWRLRRIDLATSREDLLSQPWNPGELRLEPPISTPTAKLEFDSHELQGQESFYSVEENCSKESIYNVDENSNNTNHVEEIIVSLNLLTSAKDLHINDTESQDAMTDILIEEVNSCPPSPASVVTLLHTDHDIIPKEAEAIEEDLDDINWILYPGTVSNCFGRSNDIKAKDKDCQNALLEIQVLKTALTYAENTMQPLEQTFNDTVLEIWRAELRLISFSFISHFFSPKGSECPQDFRFHLNLLKNYFLLGSAQFAMSISDAIYKDCPYGLNLNGPEPRTAAAKVNLLLLEIAKPLEWLDLDITCDGNYHRTTSTDLHLKYEAPSPFDIIISNDALEKFSSIFKFILLILRAQEALDRIHKSTRWKSQKVLRGGNSENCMMIKFFHMSHVFLTSFEHYVFQSALEAPWGLFLTQIENFVSSSSILSFNGHSDANIENLKIKFDDCTNEMLWRLFLFDKNQQIVYHQITSILMLLVEFSLAVQKNGNGRSFARLFFDFEAELKSLLLLLKDSFQREEFCSISYSKSFEPVYELFVGLGGEVF